MEVSKEMMMLEKDIRSQKKIYIHNNLFLLNHICTPYLKTDTGNLLILFSVMGSKTRFHKKLYGNFQRNDDVRKRAKKPKSLARNSSFFTHYKLVWLGFLKLSPGAQSCRLEVEKKTKGSWASSLDLLT